MTRTERIDAAVRNVLERGRRRYMIPMLANYAHMRSGHPDCVLMPIDFFPAVRLEFRKLGGLPMTDYPQVSQLADHS
jgi:hypothetical protein